MHVRWEVFWIWLWFFRMPGSSTRRCMRICDLLLGCQCQLKRQCYRQFWWIGWRATQECWRCDGLQPQQWDFFVVGLMVFWLYGLSGVDSLDHCSDWRVLMVVGKWESMRGGFGRDSILWTGSGFALILSLMQDRFKRGGRGDRIRI